MVTLACVTSRRSGMQISMTVTVSAIANRTKPMTDMATSKATPEKMTSDSTPAAIHLARLEQLGQWFDRAIKAGERHTRKLQTIKARAPAITASQEDVKRKQEWAESVRWAIERERAGI